jgi:hypothetical protein
MSSNDPTLLKRLGEEIRMVCRTVAEDGKESVFSARRGAERAIGEWLISVRQTKEAPAASFRPARHRISDDFSLRGDLTRVHVMKVKKERGTMQDALVRTTLF